MASAWMTFAVGIALGCLLLALIPWPRHTLDGGAEAHWQRNAGAGWKHAPNDRSPPAITATLRVRNHTIAY